MTLVFTYGTLKGMKLRFGSGSPLQATEFVGHALTKDLFNLIDGGFPIALESGDIKSFGRFDGHIIGEVYAIKRNVMESLDSYEGYPDYYTRREYTVNFLKGGSTKAWIYTGTGARESVNDPGRNYIMPDADKTLYWRYASEIPLDMVG